MGLTAEQAAKNFIMLDQFGALGAGRKASSAAQVLSWGTSNV
jgi:hypothetical protein